VPDDANQHFAVCLIDLAYGEMDGCWLAHPELRAQYIQSRGTRSTQSTPVNHEANRQVFNFDSRVMDGVNNKTNNHMAIDATEFAMTAIKKDHFVIGQG
jgi:hypothetical protein